MNWQKPLVRLGMFISGIYVILGAYWFVRYGWDSLEYFVGFYFRSHPFSLVVWGAFIFVLLWRYQFSGLILAILEDQAWEMTYTLANPQIFHRYYPAILPNFAAQVVIACLAVWELKRLGFLDRIRLDRSFIQCGEYYVLVVASWPGQSDLTEFVGELFFLGGLFLFGSIKSEVKKPAIRWDKAVLTLKTVLVAALIIGYVSYTGLTGVGFYNSTITTYEFQSSAGLTGQNNSGNGTLFILLQNSAQYPIVNASLSGSFIRPNPPPWLFEGKPLSDTNPLLSAGEASINAPTYSVMDGEIYGYTLTVTFSNGHVSTMKEVIQALL